MKRLKNRQKTTKWTPLFTTPQSLITRLQFSCFFWEKLFSLPVDCCCQRLWLWILSSLERQAYCLSSIGGMESLWSWLEQKHPARLLTWATNVNKSEFVLFCLMKIRNNAPRNHPSAAGLESFDSRAWQIGVEKSLTRAQSPEIAFDFPRISGRIARDERGSKKFIKMQDETADDACA